MTGSASNEFIEYEKNLYHILGDPSTIIHTQTPVNFDSVSIIVDSEEIGGDSSKDGDVAITYPYLSVDLDDHLARIAIEDGNGKFHLFKGSSARLFMPVFPCHVRLYAQNKTPYSFTYDNPLADSKDMASGWSFKNLSLDSNRLKFTLTYGGKIQPTIGNITKPTDSVEQGNILIYGLNSSLVFSKIVPLNNEVQEYNLPSLPTGSYTVCLIYKGKLRDRKNVLVN